MHGGRGSAQPPAVRVARSETGAVVRTAAEAWGDESGGDGGGHGRGARVDAELGEDTGDMMLNRAHTDEEGSGDGRVGLPRDEQSQDVIFTWGQRYALGAGGRLERGERRRDRLRRGQLRPRPTR